MPDRPRDTPTHGVHVVRGEVPAGVVPPSTSMRPPEPAAGTAAPRPIVRAVVSIDPAVRFGRPHIGGISCEMLAEGVYGGDTCEDVATVYGLTRAEVLTACWWAGLEGPSKWRRRWAAWAAGAHPELAKGAYDAIPDPPDYEETSDA